MNESGDNSRNTSADAGGGAQAGGASTEAKRQAARRRFMRMGAGGSAGLMVTVVHKRSFAQTIKKGAIMSTCTSLMGVPDIKGLNSKKALQFSALGSPKHAVCNPKPSPNTCTVPNKTGSDASKWVDKNGKRHSFFSSNQFKHGCGTLGEYQSAYGPPSSSPTVFDGSVAASYDYRLYEKGYCPVIITSSGDLTYDKNAKYYWWTKANGDPVGRNGDGSPKLTEAANPNPNSPDKAYACE